MTEEHAPNPYAAPASDVSSGEVPAGITAFPRESTVLFFVLSIITLGIYAFYWGYDRTQILNRVHAQNPVSPIVWQAAITLQILNLLSGFADSLFGASNWWGDVSIGLNIVAIVANWVWVFSMRSRLNNVVGAVQGGDGWFKAVLTFLFGNLYLCYKINGNIDRAGERMT